nr:helix-turn-helix domain-containing protein [Nitrosomonas nitrosa]
MSTIDPTLRALAHEIGTDIARYLSVQLQRGSVPVAPEYLTTFQVAQLTGFSPKGLENMRARGEGPPFLKVGNSVRYRVADVRAWIEKGGQL